MNPIPLSQVFTFLFLMIGPLKLLGPFVKRTKTLDASALRSLAFKATLMAAIILAAGAFVGEKMLGNFGIPVATLGLAAGLVLFLVALRTVMGAFDPPAPANTDDDGAPTAPTAGSIAFPIIVAPYGIAALIVFVTIAGDTNTKLSIGGIVLAILALDLVTMLFARQIVKVMRPVFLVLGVVVGIIQVALGLHIMVQAVKILFGPAAG